MPHGMGTNNCFGCDRLPDECVCSRGKLVPFRGDRDTMDALMKRNAELERIVERGELTELDVQRARVALHVTISLTLYTAVAAFCEAPLLDHPHLAAFIASANLLVWTFVSLMRKFGT